MLRYGTAILLKSVVRTTLFKNIVTTLAFSSEALENEDRRRLLIFATICHVDG